jgi:hypothetical protein
MRFILYKNIVPKMFFIITLLNAEHLLELYRLVYIMFFPLWKEAVVHINWGIRDT